MSFFFKINVTHFKGEVIAFEKKILPTYNVKKEINKILWTKMW